VVNIQQQRRSLLSACTGAYNTCALQPPTCCCAYLLLLKHSVTLLLRTFQALDMYTPEARQKPGSSINSIVRACPAQCCAMGHHQHCAVLCHGASSKVQCCSCCAPVVWVRILVAGNCGCCKHNKSICCGATCSCYTITG
jgi:hypothetical protein